MRVRLGWPWLLLSLGLASGPALGAKLELEVGAGTTVVPSFGPSVTGRIGLDLLDHLTPSVRGLTLATGDGHSLWALLGELRVHTSGLIELNAGVGLGVGHALLMGDPTQGLTAHFERVQPYVTGDVGARVRVSDMWIGLNVGPSPNFSGWLATLSVGWAPLKS